jgi:DUF4097 and DUF4098 domain-containing protein YvlB
MRYNTEVGSVASVRVLGLVVLIMTGTAPARATAQGQSDDDRWRRECERDRDQDRAPYCEVRLEHMSTRGGRLEVGGLENGSVAIRGGDVSAIEIHTLIDVEAPSEEEAKEIARRVEVEAEAGSVRARGPETKHWRSWSVSYQILVPRHYDISLAAENGDVDVTDVSGHLDLGSENGDVTLDRVGGAIRLKSENGSVDVTLAGTRLGGEGLDVESENGSVHVRVPADFAAHIDARSETGSMAVDFPVTVQGRLDPHHITTDIGGGGPAIRISSENGSVSIEKHQAL